MTVLCYSLQRKRFCVFGVTSVGKLVVCECVAYCVIEKPEGKGWCVRQQINILFLKVMNVS